MSKAKGTDATSIKFNYSKIKRRKAKDNIPKPVLPPSNISKLNKNATINYNIMEVLNTLNISKEDLEKYKKFLHIFNENQFGLTKISIEYVKNFSNLDSFTDKIMRNPKTEWLQNRSRTIIFNINVYNDKKFKSFSDLNLFIDNKSENNNNYGLLVEFIYFKLILICRHIVKAIQRYNKYIIEKYDKKGILKILVTPIINIKFIYNNAWYKILKRDFEKGIHEFNLKLLLSIFYCNIFF